MTSENLNKIQGFNADAYLQKPFELNNFYEMIDSFSKN